VPTLPSEGAEGEGYGNEPVLRSRGRGGRGRGRGVPRAATKGKNLYLRRRGSSPRVC
jgi:hypothetical protein